MFMKTEASLRKWPLGSGFHCLGKKAVHIVFETLQSSSLGLDGIGKESFIMVM